ncbi:saccharopine dehydrogenase [Spongiactinospora gelatinilytica]|uniref:Saccharopine dehydrogenase n=1 Tax=Spongiactinospora gelatinilytica TaxID=2666298 RepID=A0A2W2G341_9ACTN|nr:saccharopine dehydrogenase C-terminal domain-containing protein [Spongiactinospora gelatinilytica]PZG31348.1 saccharopine dehydrogenase [Spongiactinospora gelatinilytica]
MSDLITPTGRVHWVGTGLSTGSGLGLVCDRAAGVVLWGRTRQKAEDRLAALGLAGRAETREFGLAPLAAEVEAGDLVVSMLPAAHHAGLLRLCLGSRAHFAASSYVSAEISALAAGAAEAGVVVLTEAGLDPGIDHLLAHLLVAEARAAVGNGAASAVFTSYCGSNPAEPNDFRYRFNWAPRGVLTALLTPARYIGGGERRAVDRPWEAVGDLVLGEERFEVYPNRDSVPFVEQYGLPGSWRLDTFVRGTIRLSGWKEAWAPVFAELRDADDERIGDLARRLALRYPGTETDHDRVLLSVALSVRGDDGSAWSGEYVLDAVGDEKEAATPRLVSTALACGIGDILAGLTPPGLHRAAEEPEAARRWLTALEGHGITCAFRRP